MKAMIRIRHPSRVAKVDAGAPRRWRTRSIAAYAILIVLTAAGYALVIAAFDAVIKPGT